MRRRHERLHDDEGNRTKKTEIATGDYVEYEWDHRNRLTKVTFRDDQDAKTKEVIYTYDEGDRDKCLYFFPCPLSFSTRGSQDGYVRLRIGRFA